MPALMSFFLVPGWEVMAPFYGQGDVRRKGPCGVPWGEDIQTLARRLSDSSCVSRPCWLQWLWPAGEGTACCGCQCLGGPGSREAGGP